jgi:hypothetical protein
VTQANHQHDQTIIQQLTDDAVIANPIAPET